MPRPLFRGASVLVALLAVHGCAKDERRAEVPATQSQIDTLSLPPPDSLAPPSGEGMLAIRGSLTYRERMALPPDGRIVVEVREGSGDDGPLVVERTMTIEGKEVPIPFAIHVPLGQLSSAKTYRLRGAVFAGGLPAWVSDGVAIDAASGNSIDLGEVMMARPAPGAYKSTMKCGDEVVTVGFSKTAMLLTVGGEVFEMRPVEAASGTRYEAMNDPTTTFWNKGDRSTITVRGRTLPECGRGSPVEESAAPPAPSPLQGTQWVVQDIGGTKVLDTPQVTLAFGSDGRVSGKSSCNSYTGQYALSGEGMTVSELTSTLMACDDPRMEQEKKFLDVVRHASRFEIGADGALILHTADGRKLTARRI